MDLVNSRDREIWAAACRNLGNFHGTAEAAEEIGVALTPEEVQRQIDAGRESARVRALCEKPDAELSPVAASMITWVRGATSQSQLGIGREIARQVGLGAISSREADLVFAALTARRAALSPRKTVIY